MGGINTLEPELPQDVAVLQGMIRELLATHQAQQRQIDQLTHRLDLLLKRVYGPRADQLDPRQQLLFTAPPADTPLPLPSPPEPEVTTTTVKQNGHGRRKLPENLKRETEVIDVPESVKQAIGGTWQQIGEEISEKLDYTPSSLFVRRIVRPKYVVRFPDTQQPDELKIAELPPEALPKSKAAPGLVADVVVSKLVDHLPLYRQQQRYTRQGFAISRSTLCGWLAEAAQVLTPLWRLHQAHVLAADIVHTDDTPVPVQDPDRKHCRTGRLWAYVSRHGTVFDTTPDRSRAGPLNFLDGFRGYLQCDAYAGYDELFRRSQGTVIEVGCWAHARRKFVEAEKTSPRAAHEAVARIKQLYAIEHEAKESAAAERLSLRQEQSVPLLSSLQVWLDEIALTALPKSPLGEAVTYARNQWTALNVYVTDGRLAIDNNLAERAVKPFAIGRKNWLFFGSDDGGRRLAQLASFTATCQQFGVNPWTWLKETLTLLPITPANQLATLLPVPPQFQSPAEN
ncbi:MAG: IS66 family transposase [Planctomycetaceae bacterium]|nr:IS66 family transposase [Planctomycetaceae bacterium]